jgi:hypothetical protein
MQVAKMLVGGMQLANSTIHTHTHVCVCVCVCIFCVCVCVCIHSKIYKIHICYTAPSRPLAAPCSLLLIHSLPLPAQPPLLWLLAPARAGGLSAVSPPAAAPLPLLRLGRLGRLGFEPPAAHAGGGCAPCSRVQPRTCPPHSPPESRWPLVVPPSAFPSLQQSSGRQSALLRKEPVLQIIIDAPGNSACRVCYLQRRLLLHLCCK